MTSPLSSSLSNASGLWSKYRHRTSVACNYCLRTNTYYLWKQQMCDRLTFLGWFANFRLFLLTSTHSSLICSHQLLLSPSSYSSSVPKAYWVNLLWCQDHHKQTICYHKQNCYDNSSVLVHYPSVLTPPSSQSFSSKKLLDLIV